MLNKINNTLSKFAQNQLLINKILKSIPLRKFSSRESEINIILTTIQNKHKFGFISTYLIINPNERDTLYAKYANKYNQALTVYICRSDIQDFLKLPLYSEYFNDSIVKPKKDTNIFNIIPPHRTFHVNTIVPWDQPLWYNSAGKKYELHDIHKHTIGKMIYATIPGKETRPYRVAQELYKTYETDKIYEANENSISTFRKNAVEKIYKYKLKLREQVKMGMLLQKLIDEESLKRYNKTKQEMLNKTIIDLNVFDDGIHYNQNIIVSNLGYYAKDNIRQPMELPIMDLNNPEHTSIYDEAYIKIQAPAAVQEIASKHLIERMEDFVKYNNTVLRKDAKDIYECIIKDYLLNVSEYVNIIADIKNDDKLKTLFFEFSTGRVDPIIPNKYKPKNLLEKEARIKQKLNNIKRKKERESKYIVKEPTKKQLQQDSNTLTLLTKKVMGFATNLDEAISKGLISTESSSIPKEFIKTNIHQINQLVYKLDSNAHKEKQDNYRQRFREFESMVALDRHGTNVTKKHLEPIHEFAYIVHYNMKHIDFHGRCFNSACLFCFDKQNNANEISNRIKTHRWVFIAKYIDSLYNHKMDSKKFYTDYKNQFWNNRIHKTHTDPEDCLFTILVYFGSKENSTFRQELYNCVSYRLQDKLPLPYSKLIWKRYMLARNIPEKHLLTLITFLCIEYVVLLQTSGGKMPFKYPNDSLNPVIKYVLYHRAQLKKCYNNWSKEQPDDIKWSSFKNSQDAFHACLENNVFILPGFANNYTKKNTTT